MYWQTLPRADASSPIFIQQISLTLVGTASFT